MDANRMLSQLSYRSKFYQFLQLFEDEACSYAKPFEDGTPDLSLRYAYHPHENAEEEDLPDPDIEEGALLSESQLFILPPDMPFQETRLPPAV